MINLKNKWVFITGASRGIGYLTAIFMAKQGCKLILHSTKPDNIKDIASKMEEFGVEYYTVSADFSNSNEVEKMLQKIDEFGIDVDIVLNNAGLQVTYRNDYFKTPVEDFITSFNINTIAPTMICYHFLPKMIKKGFGRIVNTTSGIALEPEQAGYSASKAALDKVTIDLGHTVNNTDVCINLVDPGWCRTDLGGENAPNTPDSALPGVLIGAFIDDKKSGRIFSAQDFCHLSLEEAVEKAKLEIISPY